MLQTLKRDFKPLTWLLILAGIVVNGAGGFAIARLNIPFYLDTIGTIFVAVVAGPFAGALTGLITNLILGSISPGYAPYWSVPLVIGLVAGWFANAGWFKAWWQVVVVGAVIALVAATMSTLIAGQVFGEFTFNWSYFLIEEPADKIATALIVFVVTQFLPSKLVTRLPRRENLKAE